MSDLSYFPSVDLATLQDLAPNNGCLVTSRVSVEEYPIRYMEREEPADAADSGWAFFSGVNEDEDYFDQPSNMDIFSLNTIANVDASILPLLDAPVGSAFEKPTPDSSWQKVS